MLPEGFINRIRTQDYIDADSLIRALDEPAPVSIRVNPSKLTRIPSGSEPVPWCSTGHYLDKRPLYTADPLFHAGCYYPQEASGMFLEKIFSQKVAGQEGIRILDLCGAPGGKSTHLSSMLGSKGLLVANEVIGSRVTILSENLIKWGASNTIITNNDPAAFGKLTGYFDVIFIDAPCSGEGMFREQSARCEWSENNTRLSADRQKRILMDIWPSLKNEGLLVYSTCTFNPGENEQNIRWLLAEKDAVREKIDASDHPDIVEIDCQGIGFHPGRIRGEGFFISVIRKTEKTGREKSNPAKRKMKYAMNEDLDKAVSWTSFPGNSIARMGNEIWRVPMSLTEFEYLSRSLRIITCGTRICSVLGKDYVPSSELALSDGFRKDAFPMVSLDYDEALIFLRKESLPAGKSPAGWFVAGYNGIPLGFAKNIGSRVNNYYPVGWRIRMNKALLRPGEIIKWE